MSEKSKILIIGGTGYIGKFIVAASAKSGHPTFALVRESTVSEKFEIIESFKSSGVTLVYVRSIRSLFSPFLLFQFLLLLAAGKINEICRSSRIFWILKFLKKRKLKFFTHPERKNWRSSGKEKFGCFCFKLFGFSELEKYTYLWILTS